MNTTKTHAAIPSRTLVLSDAHGYPELITGPLEAAGFLPGHDGFIYAGDFLDRGPEGAGCLALIERYATQVLVGNHELAVLLGQLIFPQDPASPALRPLLVERVHGSGRRRWQAAAVVEGILVTHAGVSDVYMDVFRQACGGNPICLADHLNEALRAAVLVATADGLVSSSDLVDERGPFWFRPDGSAGQPLAGLVQIAGHTPPEYLGDQSQLPADFHLIDPGAGLEWDRPRRFRYAVIEAGTVRVEEGSLPPTAASRAQAA